ncbi:MAG: HAD-IB family phosphatase [Planctomycetes bacterium]|nr:HAD-IB family phosphatase [Planctomycetota bacterium]
MPPPFASICFDCDSTLATLEGVDELIALVPAAARADLAALTTAAMEGRLPLAEVYESRLRVLAPTRAQLERVGQAYVDHVVPDARGVVEALQFLGKLVAIVSGGLLDPVQVLARHLGITEVHAVPLLFHDDGTYRDFDRRSPLWRNGGKNDVLRSLPASWRPLAFVGDGVTDLETQGIADRFVGFGGVVVRPKVQASAECWFATASMAPVLQFVLTEDERQRLATTARFAELLTRATIRPGR